MKHRPDSLKRVYGVAFEHLWRRSGVKAADLAAGAHCSEGYLYMIREGARLPNPSIAKGLDEVLGTGGLLVILGQVVEEEVRRGKRSRDGTEPSDPEAEMQRRNLLQQAVVALAAAGTTGPAAALEVIRNGLTSSVTHGDSPDLGVDDWERIVWGYGHGVLTESPQVQLVNLAADVAELQLQIGRTTDEARERDLSRLSGQLAGMVAISLINLGELSAATRWWITARTAADVSGDAATRAWVRGEEAVHVLYDHRPLQTCVDLADEAKAIGGIHVGAAHALAGKAYALALMGRATEAVGAVRALSDLFERLPSMVTDEHYSVFGWAEHSLRNTESIVHSHVGNLAEAGQAQDRAMEIPTVPRGRDGVQLYRAMCLAREGNIDDGMRHAQRTIEAVPAHQRTSKMLTVGRRVLDAVPAKERRRASVADLHELLTLPTTPSPN